MKPSMIKKLLCVTAISLTPFLAFAGGTNTEGDASTGYKYNPDRATQQGDMGSKGVGQTNESAKGASEQPMVDDSTLTRKVEEALKSDAMLQKLDIEVAVKGGVVTLSGEAKDVRWQGRAAQVASSIQGVKSVQNNLTIGEEKKI